MSDNGFDLGNARGYVEIDSSGVKRGMDEARRHWDAGLSSMLSGVDRIGGAMQSLGTQMTAIGAPFAAGMGVAVKSAIDFDESMTNVGAILGKTRDEMTQLNAEILEIGAASRAGPQGAADAFAEIAGGVADASIHMAILNSAVATAEAGNANLQGVTAALVSTMNSYSFAAEDAGMASDVLTQTVGMGVGSMDELAAALPQVTGLAKSTGVAFDDLGAMMALLSTRGNSFGQSATQIRAIMVAMLNPNEKMKKAFEEIGVASGQAAIEQYGLAGALKLLNEESPTFQANMAGTLGSVEALNGSIALMSDGTEEFIGQFTDGLEGATDAARELQNASPAAAMDRLMSRFAALKIELGTALIPVLVQAVDALLPLMDLFTAWVQTNPELVAGAGALVGAMVTMGPVLIGAGALLSALVSPVGLLITAVGALGVAWQQNFLGIRDTIEPVLAGISHSVNRFSKHLAQYGLDEAFRAIFGKGDVIENMESHLEGSLVMMGLSRDRAIAIVEGLWSAVLRVREAYVWLIDGLQTVGGVAQRTFTNMRKGVTDFASTTVGAFKDAWKAVGSYNDILSEGGSVVDGLIGSAEGAARNFLLAFGILDSSNWMAFRDRFEGTLYGIYDRVVWFIDTVRPLFTEFVELARNLISKIDFGKVFNIARDVMAFTSPMGIAIKTLGAFGVDFKKVFEDIVGAVTRFLGAINDGGGLFDGLRAAFGDTAFLDAFESGFNSIVDFVTNTAIPALQQVYAWFTQTALPAIVAFVETTVLPAIQGFFTYLADGWEMVRPPLEMLYNWFVNEALPAISNLITQSVIPAIEVFVGVLVSIWETVAPHLLNMYNWFVNEALPGILNFITTTVIPGVQWFIDTLKNIWIAVEPVIVGLIDWFLTNGWPVVEGIISTGSDIVNGFINVLKDIWTAVEPFVNKLLDWFQTSGWPAIEGILDAGKKIIQGVIDTFVKIWESIKTPLGEFQTGVQKIFSWIKDNVIQPVIDTINGIASSIEQALISVGLLKKDMTDVNAIASNALTGDGTGISYGGVTAPGFDTGGFTGFGPPGAIAGFVHAEEYVIPAQGVPVLRENGSRSAMEFGPGAVVIHANSYEQGRAAADGFTQRMDELRRSRG